MTTDWLLGWQNLIYVLPFGVALLYMLVYALSGLTFGDADADHDLAADADADTDAGTEVNAEADAELDADHDLQPHSPGGAMTDVVHGSDHHAESDARPDAGVLKTVLVWIGVGRVPLSILLMVLMICWGVAGFIFNQGFREKFAESWQVVFISLPAAAIISVLVTRVITRSIDRWFPLEESTARRRHDLLGLYGTAMYDINERFGMAILRDDRGELHQVPCRIAEGQPPVAKNQKVVLVSYNHRSNLYSVVRSSDDAPE